MAYAFDHDESIVPPLLTREEVEAGIAEWQRRLSDLMDMLQVWVPDDGGFRVIRNNTYSCEPRMMSVGIRQTRPFPALTVERVSARHDAERPMMHISADARWVLLTMGRLRIFHPKGMTYIEDHGEPGTPAWVIYPHRDLFNGVPLSQQEMLTLLDDLL